MENLEQDFLSFYATMDKYFKTVLKDESQYTNTVDHLIDEGIMSVDEANHIYALTECTNIPDFRDDEFIPDAAGSHCNYEAMAFHLRRFIREKLIHCPEDQGFIIKTVLYTILDQTKFDEFKAASNHLLLPQFYDQNGQLKVTRDQLLVPKIANTDWKNLITH